VNHQDDDMLCYEQLLRTIAINIYNDDDASE